MNISIGCDHAGFLHKNLIKNYLSDNYSFKFVDFGVNNFRKKVDYPDFIHLVCKSIVDKISEIGIILCGSGNGAAITANKYLKIRAALIWNKEIASLAKKHNNANIISIPSRFVNKNLIIEMLDSFFNSKYEKGVHQNRINKITSILI